MKRPIINQIPNLSSSERMILDFLNSYDQKVFKLTQKELSKVVFVSEATISRFVKKYNFKTYKEFIINFNNLLQSFNRDFNLLIPKDNDGLLQNMLLSNKYALENTIKSDTILKIERIINEITSNERIIVFGRGSSRINATNLSKNLSRLRLNSISPNSFHDFLPILGSAKMGDVFILLSNQFRSKEMKFTVNELLSTGAKIILITSNQERQYDSNFDVKITYSKIHSDNFYIPLSSKISQTIICSALFELLLQRDKEYKRTIKESMQIFYKWELHN